jgi:hypothetical protein
MATTRKTTPTPASIKRLVPIQAIALLACVACWFVHPGAAAANAATLSGGVVTAQVQQAPAGVPQDPPWT